MYVGIDVGGTNLKAGVTDEAGRILASRKAPLGEFRGAEEFLTTLTELAAGAVRDANASMEEVRYVGMGVPGAVAEGKIVYTCNIPLENVPAGEVFDRRLHVPLLLENDANCAAVGEYFCGAGRGTKDFVMVTLGTGVGGGFVLGGKLYTGMGVAGEVGHMVVRTDGVACNCGRSGCWETYASATGLIRMTREAMERNPGSLLRQLAQEKGKVDGRTAFQAAARGDETARGVCEEYIFYLAAGITNLVNIFHPEVLAIGGGVSNEADEALLFPLRALVERDCYVRHGARLTKIVKAELGNDAGIIGAALLEKAR